MSIVFDFQALTNKPYAFPFPQISKRRSFPISNPVSVAHKFLEVKKMIKMTPQPPSPAPSPARPPHTGRVRILTQDFRAKRCTYFSNIWNLKLFTFFTFKLRMNICQPRGGLEHPDRQHPTKYPTGGPKASNSCLLQLTGFRATIWLVFKKIQKSRFSHANSQGHAANLWQSEN